MLVSQEIILEDIAKRPSDYWTNESDNQKVIDLIFNNKDKIFNSLPDNFQNSNIFIQEVKPKNNEGIIQSKFKLNNFYDANLDHIDGVLSDEFILNIKAFQIDTSTTQIESGRLTNVSSFLPSDATNHQEEIKQAIIDNNFVKNLFFSLLTKSDLELEIIESNNANGSLSIKVYILNSKAQENGIQVNGRFALNSGEPIKFTGFNVDVGLQTTIFESQALLGFDEILPSELDQDNENFKNQIIKMIKNPANGDSINSNDVIITIKSRNNLLGSISIDVILVNKAWINGQVQNGSYKFPDGPFVITGFKQQAATSLKNNEIMINGLESQFASEFYKNDTNVIANLIQVNKNEIFNTIGNILEDNIANIQVTNINNKEGSLTFTFDLKSNYFNDEGILVSNEAIKSFGPLTIKGFKNDGSIIGDGTTKITNTQLEGVDQILPSTWNQNLDIIKQAIINKIENKVPGREITVNDIQLEIVGSVADYLNQIKFKVTIVNGKAQKEGIIVESLIIQPEEGIIFSGFKIDQTMTSTTIRNGNVIGFDSQLASEINVDDETFKNEIIKLISNPAPNQTIKPNDITITRISSNDVEGTMKITLTIANSKAWTDGNVQEVWILPEEHAVTISGFRSQKPTINKKLSLEIETEEIASSWLSSNQLIQYIFDNINLLFDNLPPNIEKSDIELSQANANNPKGEISVNVTLKKFVNDNGQIITDGSFGPYIITISGFKVDTSSTSINSNLNNINDILPSTIKENLERVKEAIKNNITNAYPGKELLVSDIQIDENSIKYSDIDGTATIKVTIINSKAQENGIAVNEKEFTIEFSGFKVNQDLLTTKFEGGVISGFENTLASDVNQTDTRLKEQIILLIKNPANGGKISVDDVIIEIISYDNLNGSMRISLTIINNKAWENGEVKETITLNGNITGFKIQKPTSHTGTQDNPVEINPEINEYPTIYYGNNIDKIKDLVLNHINQIFTNLPENQKSDIEIVNIITSNAQGTITVFGKVKNFYNSEGNLDKSGINFYVKFINFLTDTSTTQFKPSSIQEDNSIRLENVSGFLPSKYNENLIQLKQSIIEQIENIVKGETLTIDDVDLELISFSDIYGQIKMIVKIRNNKAQQEGITQNVFSLGSLEKPITFVGFDIDDDLTTTKFSGGRIEGFDEILASTITNDNTKFKQSLIPLIINPAKEQIIEVNDLRVEIIDANNTQSKLVINLTILNNKAWENGVIKEMTFTNVNIFGFKFQDKTKINQSIINSEISNQTPQDFIKNENNIKNLIVNKKGEIFNTIPDLFSIDNIIIIESNFNNPTGNVKIIFELNKYFDDKGIEIENGKSEKFELTLIGFKTLSGSTIIEIPSDWKFPEDWRDKKPEELDDDKLISEVINWINYPKNQDYNWPVLEKQDISIERINNNEEGSITLTITINNFKGLENGEFVKSMTFNKKINGFLISNANKKKSNLSSIIGGILMIAGGIILIVAVAIMFVKKNKSKDNDNLDNNDDKNNDDFIDPYYDPQHDPYNTNFIGYEE